MTINTSHAQAGIVDTARVTPDLSRIAHYTLADDYPKPTTIRKYSNGTKSLYYINASHVRGQDNPTCKKIREAVEYLRPDRIVIEANDPNRLIANSEIAFAHAEAVKHGIPVVCGEPQDSNLITAMQAHGYSTKDMMAFYLLRMMPQDRQDGKLMDEAHVAERAERFLSHNPVFSDIPSGERLTYVEFKRDYASKLEGKSFLNATTTDIAPYTSEHASYFQRLSATLGHMREALVDTNIGNTLSEPGVNNVLVVYGGSHRTISEPVWEATLGKGVDVSPTAIPNSIFKPNHALMLPYTEETRPLKKMPYEDPFVAHFRKGNKKLDFITTPHEHGIDTPTFKTIKQVFEAHKPDVVIFEGAPSDMSTTDAKYVDYIKKQAAKNFPNGEAEYLTYLAHQNNIPSIGGEPNKKETCAALKQKGYSDLDIRAMEVLNWIPRWVRWEGIKGDAALDAKIREQQATTEFNEVQPNAERLTLATFKQWYDAREPGHKPLEELSNNDLGPSEAPGATFVNRYGAAIGAIRNTNLDNQIAKALNEHDNVLVVYGGGHLLLSRLVYEDMLGKPEYEQLFVPSADHSQSLNMENPAQQAAWQPLKPGDSVYLIAPSYKVGDGELSLYTKMLNEWGLNVIAAPDFDAHYYNWSNPPERVAEHIIEALHTPGVKAIYQINGGEGACEVVDILKKHEAELLNSPKRGIPLLGFSDTTNLHLYLGARGIVSPVQAPIAFAMTNRLQSGEFTTALTQPPSNADRNREGVQAFLMGSDEHEPPVALQAVNRAAQMAHQVRGQLVGGCDEIIQYTHATNQGINRLCQAASKPILLLEGKSLDNLRNALNLLKETKSLDKYQAMVLAKSYFRENSQPDIASLKQTIEEILPDSTLPVYFGAPFGHRVSGMELRPMPLLTQVTITPNKGQHELKMNRRMTKADMQQATSRTENTTIKPAVAAYFRRSDSGSDTVHVHFTPSINFAEHLRIPDATGKQVVIHCDFDEKCLKNDYDAINAIHSRLMPLIASGKLSVATSLTIAAPIALTEQTTAWLKDFTEKRLPGIAVKTKQLAARFSPTDCEGIEHKQQTISENQVQTNRPSFLPSWKRLIIGGIAATATLSIAAVITGTIGWIALATAAAVGMAGVIGTYALQSRSQNTSAASINADGNHILTHEHSIAIAMIRYREDFAEKELHRRHSQPRNASIAVP